jgi:hypothetical protein
LAEVSGEKEAVGFVADEAGEEPELGNADILSLIDNDVVIGGVFFRVGVAVGK